MKVKKEFFILALVLSILTACDINSNYTKETSKVTANDTANIETNEKNKEDETR